MPPTRPVTRQDAHGWTVGMAVEVHWCPDEPHLVGRVGRVLGTDGDMVRIRLDDGPCPGFPTGEALVYPLELTLPGLPAAARRGEG